MARSDKAAGALPAASSRSAWLPRPGRALLLSAALLIGVYLLLPTLVVVPMALTKSQLIQFPPEWISIHSFRDYFRDGQWIDSTVTSFKIALLATAIACAVGVLAAIGLHGKPFPGRGVVIGLILSPIVVPLVVLALADYVFFARLRLIGDWMEIGLAHSLLVTPYVFVTVQASLVGLDPALARSARSLGAGLISVWRHVYWPAVKPGVLAGAIFAFAVSFDEVVIALFLQGPGATTLPVRMFTSIQYDLTPKIAAIATLLLGLATVALAAQGFLALRDDKAKGKANAGRKGRPRP
jgi:ABC-type spermidine/putrescine transport system permease subunit II